MGDGSSGGAPQSGAQRGIALSSAPNWAAGDRLMPQSMMQAMAVAQPYTPGVTVVSPSVQSTPQDQPQVASIPQSPLTLNPGMSFKNSGMVGQPFQTDNTTVYSPQGNGINNSPMPTMPSADQMGQFQPSSQASNTGVESGEVAIDNPKGTIAGNTQGQSPTSFQLASHIQSLLPQVQSGQSGAPASNASVNVAQAPSQSNPTSNYQMSTHDQALYPGLNKTFDFEGPELTREPNGTTSVWGIGASPGEPIPKTKDQAKQYFVQHYINNNPARSEIMNQLNTPQDVNAYAQYVINAPKKVDAFNENWRGQFGGDEWRNAMLNTQARHYNNLVTSDPKKWGQYMDGWTDRINQSRNWNPQKPGNT